MLSNSFLIARVFKDVAPPPTAPTNPPAPTPPPVSSYCNWQGCNGVVEGGDWCNASATRCQANCGGTWCTDGPPPTKRPSPPPSPKPTPKPTTVPTALPTKEPTSDPTANPTRLTSPTPTVKTGCYSNNFKDCLPESYLPFQYCNTVWLPDGAQQDCIALVSPE